MRSRRAAPAFPLLLALPVLTLAAACGGADDAGPPGPAAELAPVAFIAGCWEGPAAGGEAEGTLEEHWTPADSDMMLGTGRVFREGRVVSYEFMRMESTPEGIVYVPYPEGEEEASFRLREAGPGSVVFENLQHDFPQRIIYRRTPEGGLAVRVENQRRGMDWTLEPVACQTP